MPSLCSTPSSGTSKKARQKEVTAHYKTLPHSPSQPLLSGFFFFFSPSPLTRPAPLEAWRGWGGRRRVPDYSLSCPCQAVNTSRSSEEAENSSPAASLNSIPPEERCCSEKGYMDEDGLTLNKGKVAHEKLSFLPYTTVIKSDRRCVILCSWPPPPKVSGVTYLRFGFHINAPLGLKKTKNF